MQKNLSPEEMQRRRAAAQRRRALAIKRRRRNIIRLVLLAAAIVAAVFAVRAIFGAVRRARSERSDKPQDAYANATLTEADATDVLHLSFPLLASDGQGGMTVSQFQSIMRELHDKNYVLVNFYAQTSVETGSIAKATFSLPEGKKALVISQYEELPAAEKGKRVGIVDALEQFIYHYPDFSYQGARGILALSGKGGTLEAEVGSAAFSSQVDDLRAKGWHFASNGYEGISYGSSSDLVREDAEKWQAEIGTALGTTDILVLPLGVDIGRRSGYTEDNERYKLLQGLGFRYFLIEDETNATWVQVRPDYMRQVVHRITSPSDFQKVMDLVDKE